MEAERAIAVRIDRAGDPAVEVVVGVLDDLDGRTDVGIPLDHLDQPIAMVPVVFGDLAPLARIDLAIAIRVRLLVPNISVSPGYSPSRLPT